MAFSLKGGLLFTVCLAGLFHVAFPFQCYECNGAKSTDSCATDATNWKKTSCGLLNTKLTKCTITKVSTIGKNGSSTFKSIERGCHVEVAAFGGKSKCSESNNERTCKVICSKDLCNDVLDAEVEDCAKENCRPNSATVNGLVKSLLILVAVTVFKVSL